MEIPNVLRSNEVLTKYDNINKAGLIALDSGKITPFVLDKNLEQRLNASMLFLPSLSFDKVYKLLEGIEQNTGIKLIIARRDFPLHCTILEANIPGIFNFSRNTAVYKQCEFLLRESFYFPYLLFNGGNLLLVGDVPQAIINARKKLADLYNNLGCEKVLPMDNIFHCTISRIIKLPNNETDKMSALKTYKQTVSNIINNTPSSIGCTAYNIHVGTAYNLLNFWKQ